MLKNLNDEVFDFDQTGSNIISCVTGSSGEGMHKIKLETQLDFEFSLSH